MYGSDQFSMPLQRPVHVYIPQPSIVTPSKPVLSRSELDGYAYRQGLPQTSSMQNLSDNRAEFLVPSEMRDLSSCFSSYAGLVPNTVLTVPPSVSMAMPQLVSQDPHFTHIETSDGTLHEEERKQEREHRKRSKNWTRPETLRLIQARATFDTRFGRAGKKSDLWDQIADLLQKDGFSRDAQQCKDKWEKLSASYKEVREGTRERDDFVFHEEMHALMLGRSKKRERDADDMLKGTQDVGHVEDIELDLSGEFGLRVDEPPHFVGANAEPFVDAHPSHHEHEDDYGKNGSKCMSVMDLTAVKDLMDSYLAKQRRFFAGLLEEVERREQLKERLRQEREDRWRAEEREQRRVFTNAMIILTQRLLGDVSSSDHTSWANSFDNTSDEQGGLKKRSKNWKRSEVLELIKVRMEMDSKFSMPARRAELWEELAETLSAQDIHRDGRQCREKWEKLIAEYKEVAEGRRDQSESPFFMELNTFMEEGHCAS
ncbi:hypothetical protein GOP47_0014200 [Adiantum capillus-veneris]|uniref:Myb-like domain-containing protein n=1 Tax=Adiantum capillus-veneris TaxID=13818 RepID=A0A9D4ZE39_ADICA|nr:hypothetical protein GOP47_0014200 [Adiantum capillus-veneris]